MKFDTPQYQTGLIFSGTMGTKKVRILVGGQAFYISQEKLLHGPPSKLKQLVKSGDVDVERPADMFAAILAYYQTGELHMPMASCPAAFIQEMEFWDIGQDRMTQCCANRLIELFNI